MRRLVSSAAALAADRAAAAFGYPASQLMEEAAVRLQTAVQELSGGAPGVLYLAGPGNNGGDAWAMARHAHLAGLRPVVWALAPSSPLCRLQADWCRRLGVTVVEGFPAAPPRWLDATVWVDGLWGTGFQGPLRPEAAAVVAEWERLRAAFGARVAAIDVPSGAREGREPEEPVLRADWTLSPGPLKTAVYLPENRALCGVPRELPLGYPVPPDAAASLYERADLEGLVPAVPPHAHKGTRGHVAVAGGAEGMTGAAVLCARSAGAAGAGLVSLVVDAGLVSLIAPQVPAFQVRAESGGTYGAWVAGPGWGPDRVEALVRLWEQDVPLVVDADGLQAWKAAGLPARTAPTVFTPHPGELRRLEGDVSVEAAARLALRSGAVVVLKGSATWVVSAGRRAVWDGPEPALGTGGSGDCLAGVVGAFLAAGQGAFEAAVAAVALHGTAGAELARGEGWFTADRLPEALARVALACRTAARPL